MTAIGCGDDDRRSDPNGDAGTLEPPLDGGPSTDASAPGDDGGTTAPELVVERWGGRVRSPVLALTRVGRTLWMGTNLVEDPSDEGTIHHGLVRLDLDSGALRIYDDELPTVDDPVLGELRLPTAGVIEDGDRVIVLARHGLLEIDGDEITLHPLATSAGEPLEPTRAVLDRPATGDARLWVSTDLGLVLVDPDTLTVRSSNLPVAGPTGSLAVDPETRDVYVTQPAADAVARVRYAPVGEGPIHTSWIHMGADGVTRGTPGDVVWSTELGAALIALASFDADTGGVISWDGTDVRTLIHEGQLSLASHGEHVPFGSQVLALDETDDVLIVGGHIRSGGISGPAVGGGLVWIDLTSVGGDLRVAGTGVERSGIGGDFVAALAYDPVTNRTFASLRHPCNEVRLANVGVDVITFRGRELEVGTATLSGVRDLEMHQGALWAALRDDAPNLACEGVGTQGGLFTVHGARGGAAPAMIATRGEGDLTAWSTTRIAPNRIAFRDSDHRIVASFRDSLFAGGDEGLLINPALELGVSLRTQAAVWIDDDTFWIGGPATHGDGDGPELADVGPRGAVRVDLDQRGQVAGWQRYVRMARDAEPSTTLGLPSANVTDIVVDGAVTYLVSGMERLTSPWPYDRAEPSPFAPGGSVRRGGVTAVAADGSITVLDAGDEVPDARAAAIDTAGVLWVLDAERGLLRREGGSFVPAPMAGITIPEGSIPTGLHVEEGWTVATYSTGAAVRIDESTAWIDGAGWTWAAIERAPGVLLVGADEGLLRVRLESATDPGEPALVAGDTPPFGPVPLDPRL